MKFQITIDMDDKTREAVAKAKSPGEMRDVIANWLEQNAEAVEFEIWDALNEIEDRL